MSAGPWVGKTTKPVDRLSGLILHSSAIGQTKAWHEPVVQGKIPFLLKTGEGGTWRSRVISGGVVGDVVSVSLLGSGDFKTYLIPFDAQSYCTAPILIGEL